MKPFQKQLWFLITREDENGGDAEVIDESLAAVQAVISQSSCAQFVNEVGQACDFTLINAGGPRKTIPKGDITIADVYELLPYDFIEAEVILHSLTQINTYVASEREKASQSAQSSFTRYYNYDSAAGIDEDALQGRQVGVTAWGPRCSLIEEIKDQGTVTPASIGNWQFIPANWAAAGAERDYEVLYGTSDEDH